MHFNVSEQFGIMKRGRGEQTPEEEPLTKRINNLHLDGGSALLNGSISALTSAAGPSHMPTIPPNLETSANIIHQERLSGLPGVPVTNGLVNGMTSSATVNGLVQVGAMGRTAEDLERITNELIARREMPESLSVAYPSFNPTSNDQYFSFNKLLHDLHIERLQRLGKLPLGNL